jgi:hypothetical protein
MNEDYVWGVYEHATNHVVDSFFFEEDAQELAQFMEYGGAFDGFTPAFVIAKVELPKEHINHMFTQAFSE